MSKVAVGISGGVDSSVVVHLLKEAGHEVVGIHMKLVEENSRDSAAANDARAVADYFGIEFHLLHLEDLFDQEVIGDFVQSYLKGDTPNPCVRCNAVIKFGALWKEAQRLGCDYLATGHYVRTVQKDGHTLLAQPKDAAKDQTYFLWGVERAVLDHVMTPLGDYTKDEVRDLAASLDLFTAKKKESQEICFIPNDDYAAFLEGYCPEKLPGKGQFVTENGKKLGIHDGAWRYTIGQRRGLGLALGYPAYVIGTNAQDNTVTVGTNDSLMRRTLSARNVNWQALPCESGQAMIKIRSRDRGTLGHYTYTGDQLLVTFESPVRAITPGQSVVLYDEGGNVLAGGIINPA